MTLQPEFLTPPSGAAAEALDVVFIEGLTAPTLIGIHAAELHQAQPVVIDLCAGVPRSRACETDRIHDTIDYAVVRERLLRLLAEHRVRLLEALAEQIAALVLADFGAQWVRVKVAKPRKFDDVAAVGVVIERRAGATGGTHHPRSSAMLRLIGNGMVPGAAPTGRDPTGRA